MHDIALGQYFPGDSVMHRLDPRVKLVALIAFITVIFVVNSAASFLLLAVFTFALLLLSRIPLSVYARGMKPILFIIIFTTVINLLMTTGGRQLFSFGFIHIYEKGVINAVLVSVRLCFLMLGSGLFLTYTTSPLSLTDGLESLLSPLSKLRVPVHEFSMMMTIALRFIPTLVEETDKVMNAQKARGADFSSGGLISRAKALLPVMIPLFVSAFRRADELAVAMECRCYRGGEGRTRMKVLRCGRVDVVFLAVFALLAAAVVLVNVFFPLFAFKL